MNSSEQPIEITTDPVEDRDRISAIVEAHARSNYPPFRKACREEIERLCRPEEHLVSHGEGCVYWNTAEGVFCAPLYKDGSWTIQEFGDPDPSQLEPDGPEKAAHARLMVELASKLTPAPVPPIL